MCLFVYFSIIFRVLFIVSPSLPLIKCICSMCVLLCYNMHMHILHVQKKVLGNWYIMLDPKCIPGTISISSQIFLRVYTVHIHYQYPYKYYNMRFQFDYRLMALSILLRATSNYSALLKTCTICR